MVRTSNGFYLDAYKLLEELGYVFIKALFLGHVIEAKPYGPNDMPRMIHRQGGRLMTPRIALNDAPYKLVIVRWRKDKHSLT